MKRKQQKKNGDKLVNKSAVNECLATKGKKMESNEEDGS